MQFTTIPANEYNDKLYKLVAALENQHAPVYLDGSGLATIGAGALLKNAARSDPAHYLVDSTFRLVGFHDSYSTPLESATVKQIEDGYRNRLQALFSRVWKSPTLRASFQDQVDAIMTERYEDQRLPFVRRPFFSLGDAIDSTGDMTDARALFESHGVRSEYERRARVTFGDMPASVERAALVSLTYLGAINGVKAALGNRPVASSTRPAVWFAVRYGAMQQLQANSEYLANKNGWAKRAYASAALIGLYDTPGQPTAQEAREIFQLLSSNRTFVRDYEAEFGTSFGGVVSPANALGNSSTDTLYARALALLGKPGAKSLDQELAPAKAKLIDVLRGQDPTIPDSVSSISVYDIYVARGLPDEYRSSTDTATVASYSIDSTMWETSGRPTLLIGGARMDVLRGGSGNDVLVGGDEADELEGRGGDDVLQGGRGRDHYVFSGSFGNDVVSDLDGQGTLDLGPGDSVGEFVSDGVYRSADQLNTYTLTGGSNGENDLVISFAGKADTITVKNWSAARSMGVTLMERPRAVTAAYGNRTFGCFGANPAVYSADATEVFGTDANEWVRAGNGQHAYGAGGDDRLVSILSNTGDESAALEGGAGDDQYEVRAGYTKIYYARGDGSDGLDYFRSQYQAAGRQDVVLRDLNPSDVLIRFDLSGVLMIQVIGTDDVLYLNDFKGMAQNEGLQALQFANGESWSRNDLLIAATRGTQGNDDIQAQYGYEASNLTIDGGDGDDEIRAGVGIAEVFGGAGNDDIFVGSAARIEGGKGDDVIWTDSSRNNEIHFARGEGVDRLWARGSSASANSNEVFFDGLNSSDVQISCDGVHADLILTFANSGDGFILQQALDWSTYHSNPVDSLVENRLPAFLHFADATWTAADIKAAWQRQSESADDGALIGTSGDDSFVGTSGTDDFYTGTGNDTVPFGLDSGRDVVHSLYFASLSSTTIKLKEGVTAEALRFERIIDTDTYMTEALKLSIDGSDASITINGFFRGGLPSAEFAAVNRIEFSDGTVWDFAAIARRYAAQAAQGTSIQLSDNGESIYGADGTDTLQGGTGDDMLDGGAGDDQLSGAEGNDFLKGGTGNDRLEGGQDDDTLAGGSGQDTYVYALGDGNDTIVAADQEDSHNGTLRLVGIDWATVKLRRVIDPAYGSASALQVTMSDGGTVFVQGFFSFDDPTNPSNPIQSIAFDDGTQWDINTVAAACLLGDDGDDRLIGTAADDLLNGSSGNDVLSGQAGNDTLIGGRGYDTLDGGAGNNVFRFAVGDGVDTIQSLDDGALDRTNVLEFGDGLAPSEVTVQIVWDSQSGSYTAVQLTWASTADSVTINGFLMAGDPYGAHNPVQTISFSDGTTWSVGDMMAKLPALGSGDDFFVGTSANDILIDPNGSDFIDAEAGDDIIIDSGWGTNTLLGGDGNDNITFSATATNVIAGGDGDDVIQVDSRYGSSSLYANTLRGGHGNDAFVSGGSADLYYFDRGDGEDSIDDLGVSTQVGKGGKPVPAGDDSIVFGEGISASDLNASRVGDDLLIQIRNSYPKSADRDSILVRNWNDPTQRIETLLFADGSTMSAGELSAQAMTGTDSGDSLVAWSDATTVDGLAGDDYITSESPNAVIYGGEGNDAIYTSGGNTFVDGGEGDDVLVDTGISAAQLNGGAGNDHVTYSATSSYIIEGGEGDDHLQVADQFGSSSNYVNVIVGGGGNDSIEGGASADTYMFSLGDGTDTINDFGGVQGTDTTAGDDMLQFRGDVSFDQVWLQQVGNDLKVSLIGGNDSVAIKNWYGDPRNQIEIISTADGYSLASSQVDALVQAMASFAPPADGQSTLPDDYRMTLAPTLAASWAPPIGP